MASETYLRVRPDNTEEWVTDPKDATADYREAAEVTQARLKSIGVLSASLVEVPAAHQMQPKYIICKQEEGKSHG